MSEPVRIGLLLRVCMELLREAERPLTNQEVMERVEQRVALTPYELESDGARPRWRTILAWTAGDVATVGWMTKRDGWRLTEAGEEALETYDADEFVAEVNRRYTEIRRKRRQAEQQLSGHEQTIARVLSLIPLGSWTSYDDLAELTGVPSETIPHFLAHATAGPQDSHKVLFPDGRVPPDRMVHSRYRNIDLRKKLANEGVEFDADGRASTEGRVTSEQLRTLLTEQPEELVRRAWMVRSASVEGEDLTKVWLEEGFFSLAASHLSGVDSGVSSEALKKAVSIGYSHKAGSYQEQRLREFELFLYRMREGDLVLTVVSGNAYIGEITGPAYFTESEGRRSNLRRNVQWFNPHTPISREELRAPLPALLADQSYVIDLTEATAEVIRLTEPFQGTEPPVETAELTFPGITDEFARTLLMDRAWLAGVADRLWHRRQIVLYGPPGTGKTWLARKLAAHLTDGQDPQVKLVQFHPSYTYEDFFEGYRPKAVDGALSFELRSGPFRAFAEDAADNPSLPYVLVIDEINRANLAKVFGELYFLLEYRDAAISLQYSPGKQFQLPQNLFIIGTMNTADRSIALVDAAMRRRFAFLELHPRAAPIRSLLRNWLAEHGVDSPVADLLDALNERIADEDRAIGPSYFMREEIYRRADGLDLVWQTELMPLLEELHFGEGRAAVAERYGLESLLKAVNAQGPSPQ